MIKKPLYYFAVPHIFYEENKWTEDIQIPQAAIDLLQDAIIFAAQKLNCQILFPGSPDIKAEFAIWEAHHEEDDMEFFLRKCSTCAGGIVLTFPDDLDFEKINIPEHLKWILEVHKPPQSANRIGARSLTGISLLQSQNFPIHKITYSTEDSFQLAPVDDALKDLTPLDDPQTNLTILAYQEYLKELIYPPR